MIGIKTVPSALFSCLLALMLFASCSVKEDRNECPCTLVLDFGELDSMGVRSVNVLALSADGVVLNECIVIDKDSLRYVRTVPHGFLQVNVWAGDERGAEGSNIVQIPYGMECPPVYIHSFLADTRGERYEKKVRLKKNFCRLTVTVPEGNYVPYSLTFKGKVDGYDAGGRPSNGDFSYVAYPSEEGDSRAVLPRQVDNSLMLEVDDGVPHLKKFAIGEYLEMGGYDWDAESLDDVSVMLDYSLSSVTIRISGWDKETVYNVVL